MCEEPVKRGYGCFRRIEAMREVFLISVVFKKYGWCEL